MDPRHAPNYEAVTSGGGGGGGSAAAAAAKARLDSSSSSTVRPGAPKQPPSLSPNLTAAQPVKLSQVALYAPMMGPPSSASAKKEGGGGSNASTPSNAASKPATAKDLPLTHAVLQDIKKTLSAGGPGAVTPPSATPTATTPSLGPTSNVGGAVASNGPTALPLPPPHSGYNPVPRTLPLVHARLRSCCLQLS
jgi:hypothetical protein